VTAHLEGLGFKVYIVPETASLMLGGGVDFGSASPSQIVGIEVQFMRVQLAMEDAFCAIAADSGRPSVILFDRGAMDIAAYLPAESWAALLEEGGWTNPGLRDQRYEAVIHLVTAAEGAESFYTTQNNAVRKETPAQARELDGWTKNAWVGHPHLRVVDNSTDFQGKVRRIIAELDQVVGVP
jgi:hypothetical protein